MPAEKLSELRQVHSSLEEDPEAVREHFNTFLMSVVESLANIQRREEGSIIDGDTEF